MEAGRGSYKQMHLHIFYVRFLYPLVDVQAILNCFSYSLDSCGVDCRHKGILHSSTDYY